MKRFKRLITVLLVCLLPSCMVMSKKRYGVVMQEKYQSGYDDGKSRVSAPVTTQKNADNKLVYVFEANPKTKKQFSNNIKLMSLNALTELYESKQNLIIMKDIQINQNIPGFRKATLRNDILRLREEQGMVREIIRKRQLQR